MNARPVLVFLALAAGAGFAYAAVRPRGGVAERIHPATGAVDLPALAWDVIDMGEAVVNQWTEMPADVPEDTAARNVRAFLRAIMAAEGTDREADPYRVCFGYSHTIRDLSDHPYYTGEWLGAPFGAGQWSTAAGAYQFIRATWAELRDRLQLPDFGPASQDAAAIELIRQRGAVEDVKAGRVADAVTKVRRVWASLPGAGYGQGERSMQWLAAHYQANGGSFAE